MFINRHEVHNNTMAKNITYWAHTYLSFFLFN